MSINNHLLLNPMRILIVEDDPLMQLGLEQALGEHPNFEIVGHFDLKSVSLKKKHS